MTNQAAQTMPELARAQELLSRMQKAKLNERGHWCDARAAVDAACDILPKLIAALSQPAGVAEPLPMDTAPRDGTMVRMLVEFTDHATEDCVGPAWTIGANNDDEVGEDERVGWQFAGWCWTHDHFTEGRGTPVGWLPMLAAAPAASGVHPDALPDGTLSKSTAKRVEALAGASVSERARELLAAEYRTHGWHEDAGRLCIGGDPTSFVEDDALRVIDRLIEQGDEDAHVITELGRLLACIAVILKGPEPAGTAWSYHDLPELVASALSEPRQVAAEMKAWARTRMAEQQSSRRDRMMVSEWAKRLLPESSFPIKDFDVEGMSITKEAAREAVKRVALEQALTQQRGSVSYSAGMAMHWIERYAAGIDEECQLDRIAEAFTTPQPSADAVRELAATWRKRAERKRFVGLKTEALLDEAHAYELESLLSAASDHQQNAAQGGGEK